MQSRRGETGHESSRSRDRAAQNTEETRVPHSRPDAHQRRDVAEDEQSWSGDEPPIQLGPPAECVSNTPGGHGAARDGAGQQDSQVRSSSLSNEDGQKRWDTDENAANELGEDRADSEPCDAEWSRSRNARVSPAGRRASVHMLHPTFLQLSRERSESARTAG